MIDGVPITQHWLIPEDAPAEGSIRRIQTMSPEEIRVGTQGAWDRLLQLARRSGRARRRRVRPGAARVRAHLETVSADVREHRHRDRQRARCPIDALGHGSASPAGGCFSARRCQNLLVPEDHARLRRGHFQRGSSQASVDARPVNARSAISGRFESAAGSLRRRPGR